MNQDDVKYYLARFFMEMFREDAGHVAECMEMEGVEDIDTFVSEAQKIIEEAT